MEDIQLTTEQIVSPKTLHRLQRDRKKADCVKAVVLLGSGWISQQETETCTR